MLRFLSFALVAALTLTACASGDADPATDAPVAETVDSPEATMVDTAEEPAVYALVFAADWCSTCKELDPKLQPVMTASGDLPVEFVMLDLTDEVTTAEAAATAESLGAADLFEANAGKTGYVALVSSETGEVVGRILATDSEEEMTQKLQAATTA